MFHNYHLRPMLLEEVGKIFQSKDYLYEIKFDGFRVFIYANKDEFVILSRNGHHITKHYPELKSIQKIVGNHEIIFDGEIIATLNGLPSFSYLQKRSRVKRISSQIINEIPVTFIAFDILYDNQDLTNFSLVERKKRLEKFRDTNYFVKSRSYHNGKKLFAMVKKLHLEGVVAKKRDSRYFFGERTSDWVKIKNIKVDNFFVHGYLEKTNTYSLLLGEYKKETLNYIGKVSVNKKHDIIKKLKKLKKINNQFVNFREDAIFVKPAYLVRVRFLERTNSGMLRHATIDE